MNICTKILNKWLSIKFDNGISKNIIHYNQVGTLFQEYKDGSTYDLTNVSHQHLTVSEDEGKLFDQSHYTIRKNI